MNARTVLLAPMHASHRAMRWFSLALLVLCVGIAVVAAIVAPPARWAWIAVGVYSALLFFLWAFFLSSTALLAADARVLRIPGMQRAAALSLVFYSVLSIAPTILVARLSGGSLGAMTMVSVLCILGGLSFALLPRFIGMFMGPLPALYQNLARPLHLPDTADPRFVPWSVALALMLAVVCALRWKTVTSSSPQQQSGFTGAMVQQYRRSHWSGWGGMNGLDSTQQVRQRPDWLQPKADLRHVGPLHPGNALRVALGGWYMPRTLMGHLQTLVPILLAVTAPFAVMFLIFSQNHGLTSSLWSQFAVLMIGWVCIFGSLGLVFMTVMLMQQRWRKANAELPMLALLPGLGDACATKGQLLRVALGRPLRGLALALVVIVAMTAPAHPAAITLLIIVLGQFGIAATLVACLLGILGGKPLPGWATAALMIAVSTLVGCNSFLPSSMVGNHPWVPGTAFIASVLGGWAVVGMVLGWIGQRGWRAWHAAPHSFLPNG